MNSYNQPTPKPKKKPSKAIWIILIIVIIIVAAFLIYAINSRNKNGAEENSTTTASKRVTITEAQAMEKVKAAKECTDAGKLDTKATYNPIVNSWSIKILESSKPECSPICSVHGQDQKVTFSWNCPKTTEQ